MNETKETNVQTLNVNFGVTSEYVDLARAYLQSGAVDKEVIMRGLNILEKAVTVIATAATKKSQPTYSCQKMDDKWWNEHRDRSIKDSCEKAHN